MRFRRIRMAGLLAVLVGLTASGQVAQEGSHTALDVKATGPKTFYIDDRAGANQVSIFSESTLEDFTIVCNKLSGQCSLDPHNVESFKGEFSLRVEDLKTGIDLRDHHLRGPDWLDAAKYPKVVIKVTRVEDVKKTAPNTILFGTAFAKRVRAGQRCPGAAGASAGGWGWVSVAEERAA